MQYLTPDQVKGYTVHRKISEGGFGEVYLATESRPNFEREVVLKRILPKFGNDPRFIQRFESEARVIARLEYPYIVPLYDYWRNPDGAYLVMRWLKGGSVKDLLEQGPLDLPTTARIMNQICSALALAHKNGVIHRDIKPGNILLDEEGNAYLSDFGIAKDFMKFDSNTQPEDILGSPKYISPEQARSEVVTPRTDVYSLGITLYEMLAGEHPFPNANMYDLIYKHLNEPVPRLANFDAVVQDDINLVIEKATTKDPQKRYESALDFAQAFHAAAQLDTTTHADSLEQHLTIREQQVLSLIVDGKTNKEIASELFISAETVKWHISNAYRKLGVTRRQQAIVVARNLQLVGSDATITPSDATSYIIDFDAENPYKGLEAFTEADEGNFFGREKLVDKLVKRLGQDHPYQRFLAVLGPSGSGKSSLVRAGLVPALWEGRLPDATQWLYTTMIPRLHPVDELDIALRSVATKHTEDISDLLAHNERGLLKAARLILPEGDHELLLIIDQFEEIFTLVESEEERVHFLNLITNAVTDPDSRVRVVITIRADYYDRPLYYPQFGDILRDRVETVLPLSAEELQQAIVEPARRVGVKFEDGLVATIISDINYQPGSLPLLQYALTEMFDQRAGRTITREVYEKIGGAAGAIASTAEELFLSYDETGQETIRQMFLRLVTLGEGAEDTRRRTARDELLSIAEDSYLMDDIIDTFAYARMLSLDNDPTTREPTVEVAHEAILREWERLRGWLNDSRDDIKTQRQLSALSAEWEKHEQSGDYLVRGTRLDQLRLWSAETSLTLTPLEQAFLDASIAERERREAKEQARAEREDNLQARARHILQGLVAVFLVAAIISGVLAVEATSQRDKAEEARRDSERSAEIAQSLALASAGDAAFSRGDLEAAYALAYHANLINEAPALAESVLYSMASEPGMITRYEYQGLGNPAYSLTEDKTTLVMFSPVNQQIVHHNLTTGTADIVQLDFQNIVGYNFIHDGRSLLTTDNIGTEGPGDCRTLFQEWDTQTGEMLHELLLNEGRDCRGPGMTIADPSTSLDYGAEWLLMDYSAELNQYVLSGWRELGFPNTPVVNHRMLSELFVDARTWEIVDEYDAAGPMFNAILDESQIAYPERWFTMNTWQEETEKLQRMVIRLDLITGEILQSTPIDPSINPLIGGNPIRVTVSPSGQLLYQHYNSLLHYLVDAETGEHVLDMEIPFEATLLSGSGSFSDDESLFVSGFANFQVAVWDMSSGQVIHRLRHSGNYQGGGFFDDNQKLFTLSDQGELRIWDLTSPQSPNPMHATIPPVANYFAYSAGQTVAVFGEVNTPTFNVYRWNGTGYVLAIENITDGYDFSTISEIDLNSDGSELAVLFRDETVLIFDTTTGAILRRFDQITASTKTFAIRFTGADNVFVTFADHNSEDTPFQVEAWDSQTGENLWRIGGIDHEGNPIKLGPQSSIIMDEQRIWVRKVDPPIENNPIRILIMDLQTGEPIVEIGEPGVSVRSLDFSPDLRTVVTANEDGILRFYELDTGVEYIDRQVSYDASRLQEVHFIDEAGKFVIVAGSDDGAVINTETGQVVRSFPLGLMELRRHPTDEDSFIGLTWDNGIVVNQIDTRIDTEELIKWFEDNRYIRDLTVQECQQYQVPQFCEE